MANAFPFFQAFQLVTVACISMTVCCPSCDVESIAGERLETEVIWCRFDLYFTSYLFFQNKCACTALVLLLGVFRNAAQRFFWIVREQVFFSTPPGGARSELDLCVTSLQHSKKQNQSKSMSPSCRWALQYRRVTTKEDINFTCYYPAGESLVSVHRKRKVTWSGGKLNSSCRIVLL